MIGEKGPDTGPAMFAGVDAPARDTPTTRNDSVSETVVGHESPSSDEGLSHLPEVDMAYAASLKPSKLHGSKLLLMVTFVCGTGVSRTVSLRVISTQSADCSSSFCSDTIKAF